MAKQVIIVASGETERKALPQLLSSLSHDGISVDDVLIPPNHGALTSEMVVRLIKAAWYRRPPSEQPDKFVILMDADGQPVDEVLAEFYDLEKRLEDNILARVLTTAAQWHLEAWFFADAQNLRSYIGGSLGSVDASQPDDIENPKLCLKHLLEPRIYTSRIARDIAQQIDPETLQQRSPSFADLIAAIQNGGD